jgi:hypothetical protein
MSVRSLAQVTTIPNGTVVGFVLVRKHIEHRVSSEYAAWGHTIMGDAGRFPVKLVRSEQYNDRGLARERLVAEIPGTVVNNDYQSRCAGVAYGSDRINDMVGRRETFTHSWSIDTFFNGQSSELAFYIEPEYIANLVVEVQEYLLGVIAEANEGIQSLVNMLTTPCGTDGVVGEFDGKYDRLQAGHCAFHAANLQKALKLLETIQGENKFQTKPLTVQEQIDGWRECNANYRRLMDSNDQHYGVDTNTNIPYPMKETV